MLSVTRVREVLSLNFDTGDLIWLTRPVRIGHERADRSWNAKCAGKIAGSVFMDGYRHVKIDRKLYVAHRVVWVLAHGKWPDGDIDHIDGARDDNRPHLLRDATTRQNIQNQKVRRDNRSGLKGVSWNIPMKKWWARITICGNRIPLGYFDTPEEAHAAYFEAARKHFGEFARAA